MAACLAGLSASYSLTPLHVWDPTELYFPFKVSGQIYVLLLCRPQTPPDIVDMYLVSLLFFSSILRAWYNKGGIESFLLFISLTWISY